MFVNKKTVSVLHNITFLKRSNMKNLLSKMLLISVIVTP